MAVFNSIFKFNSQNKKFEPQSFAAKQGIGCCVIQYLNGLCGKVDDVGECQFRLVFHDALELSSGNWQAQQGFLKDTCTKKEPFPIIHVTTYDIFRHDIPELPTERYKKIINSSIWNYYVPLDVMDKDDNGIVKKDEDNKPIWKYDDNYDLFANILKEISINTDNHLYTLSITHEYADLNARLLEQSHLNGAHKDVSPFLFHSEREMESFIEDLSYGEDKKKKVKDVIKEFKWRLLLVDDKSIEYLKTETSGNKKDINKLQIIYDNLHNILGFDSIWFRRCFDDNGNPEYFGEICNNNTWLEKDKPKKDNFEVVVDCVPSIAEALRCLKKNEYEVILLDYLLGDDSYGYELLKEIKENHNSYRVGPNKRFSFMFISAFTTAVKERMLEQGFNKSERNLWYIGDGACPTNTPYLFSYQLLLLMRHRLTDLSKENEGGMMTIVDLLENIYKYNDQAGTGEVRERAHKHFNDLLYMRSKYKSLENDLDREEEPKKDEKGGLTKQSNGVLVDMRSSLLVYSAFKVVHHFSGAFFEHLQHLVYLTAFGTIRQWQDMWEEYVFVYKELCEYDKLVKKNEYDTTQRGKDISEAIREYIINLKENNY